MFRVRWEKMRVEQRSKRDKRRNKKSQSRSGITGLSLTHAACVSSISKKTIKAAMESVKTKDVFTWIRSNIGDTVQSKRKKIYQGISDNNNREIMSCRNHAVAA